MSDDFGKSAARGPSTAGERAVCELASFDALYAEAARRSLARELSGLPAATDARADLHSYLLRRLALIVSFGKPEAHARAEKLAAQAAAAGVLARVTVGQTLAARAEAAAAEKAYTAELEALAEASAKAVGLAEASAALAADLRRSDEAADLPFLDLSSGGAEEDALWDRAAAELGLAGGVLVAPNERLTADTMQLRSDADRIIWARIGRIAERMGELIARKYKVNEAAARKLVAPVSFVEDAPPPAAPVAKSDTYEAGLAAARAGKPSKITKAGSDWQDSYDAYTDPDAGSMDEEVETEAEMMPSWRRRRKRGAILAFSAGAGPAPQTRGAAAPSAAAASAAERYARTGIAAERPPPRQERPPARRGAYSSASPAEAEEDGDDAEDDAGWSGGYEQRNRGWVNQREFGQQPRGRRAYNQQTYGQQQAQPQYAQQTYDRPAYDRRAQPPYAQQTYDQPAYGQQTQPYAQQSYGQQTYEDQQAYGQQAYDHGSYEQQAGGAEWSGAEENWGGADEASDQGSGDEYAAGAEASAQTAAGEAGPRASPGGITATLARAARWFIGETRKSAAAVSYETYAARIEREAELARGGVGSAELDWRRAEALQGWRMLSSAVVTSGVQTLVANDLISPSAGFGALPHYAYSSAATGAMIAAAGVIGELDMTENFRERLRNFVTRADKWVDSVNIEPGDESFDLEFLRESKMVGKRELYSAVANQARATLEKIPKKIAEKYDLEKRLSAARVFFRERFARMASGRIDEADSADRERAVEAAAHRRVLRELWQQYERDSAERTRGGDDAAPADEEPAITDQLATLGVTTANLGLSALYGAGVVGEGTVRDGVGAANVVASLFASPETTVTLLSIPAALRAADYGARGTERLLSDYPALKADAVAAAARTEAAAEKSASEWQKATGTDEGAFRAAYAATCDDSGLAHPATAMSQNVFFGGPVFSKVVDTKTRWENTCAASRAAVEEAVLSRARAIRAPQAAAAEATRVEGGSAIAPPKSYVDRPQAAFVVSSMLCYGHALFIEDGADAQAAASAWVDRTKGAAVPATLSLATEWAGAPRASDEQVAEVLGAVSREAASSAVAGGAPGYEPPQLGAEALGRYEKAAQLVADADLGALSADQRSALLSDAREAVEMSAATLTPGGSALAANTYLVATALAELHPGGAASRASLTGDRVAAEYLKTQPFFNEFASETSEDMFARKVHRLSAARREVVGELGRLVAGKAPEASARFWERREGATPGPAAWTLTDAGVKQHICANRFEANSKECVELTSRYVAEIWNSAPARSARMAEFAREVDGSLRSALAKAGAETDALRKTWLDGTRERLAGLAEDYRRLGGAVALAGGIASLSADSSQFTSSVGNTMKVLEEAVLDTKGLLERSAGEMSRERADELLALTTRLISAHGCLQDSLVGHELTSLRDRSASDGALVGGRAALGKAVQREVARSMTAGALGGADGVLGDQTLSMVGGAVNASRVAVSGARMLRESSGASLWLVRATMGIHLLRALRPVVGRYVYLGRDNMMRQFCDRMRARLEAAANCGASAVRWGFKRTSSGMYAFARETGRLRDEWDEHPELRRGALGAARAARLFAREELESLVGLCGYALSHPAVASAFHASVTTSVVSSGVQPTHSSVLRAVQHGIGRLWEGASQVAAAGGAVAMPWLENTVFGFISAGAPGALESVFSWNTAVFIIAAGLAVRATGGALRRAGVSEPGRRAIDAVLLATAVASGDFRMLGVCLARHAVDRYAAAVMRKADESAWWAGGVALCVWATPHVLDRLISKGLISDSSFVFGAVNSVVAQILALNCVALGASGARALVAGYMPAARTPEDRVTLRAGALVAASVLAVAALNVTGLSHGLLAGIPPAGAAPTSSNAALAASAVNAISWSSALARVPKTDLALGILSGVAAQVEMEAARARSMDSFEFFFANFVRPLALRVTLHGLRETLVWAFESRVKPPSALSYSALWPPTLTTCSHLASSISEWLAVRSAAAETGYAEAAAGYVGEDRGSPTERLRALIAFHELRKTVLQLSAAPAIARRQTRARGVGTGNLFDELGVRARDATVLTQIPVVFGSQMADFEHHCNETRARAERIAAVFAGGGFTRASLSSELTALAGDFAAAWAFGADGSVSRDFPCVGAWTAALFDRAEGRDAARLPSNRSHDAIAQIAAPVASLMCAWDMYRLNAESFEGMTGEPDGGGALRLGQLAWDTAEVATVLAASISSSALSAGLAFGSELAVTGGWAGQKAVSFVGLEGRAATVMADFLNNKGVLKFLGKTGLVKLLEFFAGLRRGAAQTGGAPRG